MKAWVIKRDDGKYMDYSGRIDYEIATDYINEATFYDYPPNKKCLSQNEKIVPVTILEGDIETENKILETALELACEHSNLFYCPSDDCEFRDNPAKCLCCQINYFKSKAKEKMNESRE